MGAVLNCCQAEHPLASPYYCYKLCDTVWYIIENAKEAPLIYVIKGQTKLIVIDTGMGSGNLKEFIDLQLNPEELPYEIICTHIHYDHIGGSKWFRDECGQPLENAVICMGAKNQKLVADWKKESMADKYNTLLSTFTVDRWLQDEAFIYLDDQSPKPENALQIIFTPGHTIGTIALYYDAEQLLFVGDNVYRDSGNGGIKFYQSGSLDKYAASLMKLSYFIRNKGLEQTKLCCGHYDVDLDCSSIKKLIELVSLIQSGSIRPAFVEKNNVQMKQYHLEPFSILMEQETPVNLAGS